MYTMCPKEKAKQTILQFSIISLSEVILNSIVQDLNDTKSDLLIQPFDYTRI